MTPAFASRASPSACPPLALRPHAHHVNIMATDNTPYVAHEPANAPGVTSSSAVFARLLVPIDFSASARQALALALDIAERYGSEVTLFHASGFDDNDEFLDHTGVPWGRSDVLGEAHGHLIRFADAIAPGSGQRIRVIAVRDEDPMRAILRACESYKPSAVFVGTHLRERRSLRRTRAEKLVRRLACAVILVRTDREPKMDADS